MDELIELLDKGMKQLDEERTKRKYLQKCVDFNVEENLRQYESRKASERTNDYMSKEIERLKQENERL